MFESLLRNERTNAVIGWLMVGTVALAAAVALFRGEWLWSLFSLAFAIAAVLPALRSRDWEAMVPWPLLVLAAVAISARAVDVAPDMASYLAISALAIVFVVELVAFTEVEFSHRFAVAFAVLTTMAIEAVWIMVQYHVDLWFGTELIESEASLQQDILLVTVVGFAAGLAFQWFFMQFEPVGTLDRSSRRAEAQ